MILGLVVQLQLFRFGTEDDERDFKPQMKCVSDRYTCWMSDCFDNRGHPLAWAGTNANERLKDHFIAVHENGYKCQICSIKFTRKDNLKVKYDSRLYSNGYPQNKVINRSSYIFDNMKL